jgi:hypothetical protein
VGDGAARHRRVRPGRAARRALLGVFVPGDGAVVVGGSILVIGTMAAFWAFATTVSPDIWVPMLVATGLTIVSVPIALWAGEGNRTLRRLLVLALILKLLAVFPRYYMNEEVYGGSADSGQYHVAGQVMYLNVHEEGEWSLEGAAIDTYSDETRVVGYVTGVVYLVVGTSKVGGYMAFSWLCWLGLVWFFRAFRIAYPNAPPILPAALLFLLPSMLYWPSSIGKDALMVCALGLLSLGFARLLTPSRAGLGLLYLLPSAALILQVRPHLLMVALVGGAVSLVARNATRTKAATAAASRILILVALVPLLVLGMGRMDDLFGSSADDSGFSVTNALERTTEQTSQGGSAFETQAVTNPLDLPVAVVSVLYRPFPFEVNSAPVLISSLEGTLLLVLTLAAGRWIWRIGPATLRHPFTAFCAGYSLAFVFAFSNVGNAGILARQRVQLFPLVVLLVGAAWAQHHADLQSLEDDGGEAGASDRALVLAP